MKKYILNLSALMITALSSLCASDVAAAGSASGGGTINSPPSSQQQMQMMTPSACDQLSVDEKNFAMKLTDMNNKKMFCSQFTTQQRQQAMRMAGQPDASGKPMTADQAVQASMGPSGGTAAKPKSSGGCPVTQ